MRRPRYDSAAGQGELAAEGLRLVKLGPRQEQIDAMRGQVEQAAARSLTPKPSSTTPSSARR